MGRDAMAYTSIDLAFRLVSRFSFYFSFFLITQKVEGEFKDQIQVQQG